MRTSHWILGMTALLAFISAIMFIVGEPIGMLAYPFLTGCSLMLWVDYWCKENPTIEPVG